VNMGLIVSGGGILVYGSFYSLSDERSKKDIQEIDCEKALDVVRKIEPVSFKWKHDDSSSIGFIAQEVEKIVPELVKNGPGLKTLDYQGMYAVLFAAFKQLTCEFEMLKKIVRQLTNE